MPSKKNTTLNASTTLQLSTKTLLRPFNTALSSKVADNGDTSEDEEEDLPIQVLDEEFEEEEERQGNKDDDGIDELDMLSEVEQTEILEDTTAVHATVMKVHNHNVCLHY
jgi:hypothetical protein